MYKITLTQRDYNRITLNRLDREEAIGIMFGLIGHFYGSITLDTEEEEEEKEEAPC